MQLHGCYTALVTPFADGAVCYDTLRQLVEEQVAGGVDGIVPVGTTGESPTLDMHEHEKVIGTVIDTVSGRCKVIAGTGGNSTAEALELTRHARDAGADATLQVTPYYNKPTQEGLYRHFAAVAELGLPVMLYNVPGRSGVPIDVATVARLASVDNIVAVKEAGGSADRVSDILSRCDITVLSGDDPLTLPMMVLGAKGVVSVASNLLPGEVTRCVHLALEGNFEAARAEHYKLYELYKTFFIETNPIPIKTAMALTGKVNEEFRLPLSPISAGNRQTLIDALRRYGIEV
jgi:4-hydroxy-tetrahydrodipicolinate synthase